MSLTIRLEGLEEMLAACDSKTLIGPPIRKAFQRSTLLIQREAAKNAPKDVGRLAQSITTQIDRSLVPKWGTVGTNLKYAPVMEHGRRPGQKPPPYKAILVWVRHKLTGIYAVKPSANGTHRRVYLRGAARSAQERAEIGLAIAIAKSIGKKGIEGRHYFEKAFKDSVPSVQNYFNTALQEIANNWGKK